MTTITTKVKLFPYPTSESETERIDYEKERLEREGYTTKSFLVNLSTFHFKPNPPEFMLVIAIK